MKPLAWKAGRSCRHAAGRKPLGKVEEGIAARIFKLLKGHGNEADFLGFLQTSVRHRFLALHFEPFRFGLRRDIRNRKTTP
jgi:hypothetical protein